MEIRINTNSYNHRRYGRPWIAKVDFSTPKGDFSWGDWTGDAYNGGEGVLSIDAVPGDIIATGQKDNRKPSNSAPYFYVVTAAGEIENIGDKGTAYKYYLDHKNSPTRLQIDLVVTRHPGLVEYLRELGIVSNDVEVITHATPEAVTGRNVCGVLPHSLSCLTASFTEIPLSLTPELRGVELDLETLRKIAGEPVTYKVERI